MQRETSLDYGRSLDGPAKAGYHSSQTDFDYASPAGLAPAEYGGDPFATQRRRVNPILQLADTPADATG